jgi:putative serine protease PepD
MTDTHPNPASAPEPGASPHESEGAWATSGSEQTAPLPTTPAPTAQLPTVEPAGTVPAAPPVPPYQPTAHQPAPYASGAPIDGTVLPGFAPPPAPYQAQAYQAQAQAAYPTNQAAYPGAPVYSADFSAESGQAGFGGAGFGGGDDAQLGAEGDGEGVPAKRSWKRRPLMLVAAVALISALAGGVAGGYISTSTQKAGNYSTSAVVTSDSKSTNSVAAIAAAVSPATVQITVDTANSEDIGTGIVLTSTGQILTNYHVISSAAGNSQATIKITFSNGKTTSASIVGTDAGSDIAVIKAANVSGLPVASLGDSSQVAIGDSVVAIGNPDGLTGTVTAGIVSALNRKVTVDVSEATTQSNGGFGFPSWSGQQGYGGSSNGSGSSAQTATYNAIQTDASLNPGNSGGPLLNSAGQVIGINASMYNASSSSGSESSGTQAGSVGLGFAIPINTVKAVLGQLQNGQSINS